MAKFSFAKTCQPLPDGLITSLQQAFKGLSDRDEKMLNKFWRWLVSKDEGEICEIETHFPRRSAFHRKHMAMEQLVFNNQEVFTDFDIFRAWLKIGAGLCDFIPSAHGMSAIPRSISYAKMDDAEFADYHDKTITFILSNRARATLWPHHADYDVAELIGEFL